MPRDSRRKFDRREMLAMAGAGGGVSLFGGERAAGQASSPPRAERLKIIGVLGGLGPQATMDFEAQVHRAAQRLIPQQQNSGYPMMVVYYHRRPPIVLNPDGSPKMPIQPDPDLLSAAGRLGAWADFLVIPSNTPHLVQPEIEKAAGRSVLSMITVTVDEIRRRNWRRVGLLGYGEPLVYMRPLGTLKIEYETIDANLRGRVDAEVVRVMEGRNDDRSTAVTREAIATLRAKKVDGIVLGCTELPLMLPQGLESDLLDPARLLAEAAVRFAMATA
jgi:aspartate racemase